MKKIEISIETYDYDGTNYIDIVTLKDTYEAWIYNKNSGTKHHMFGILKRISYDSFVALAESNADTYIFKEENND